VRHSLKLIHSALFPLLLAYVVKHILKVLAGRSKVDLILPAIKLIIQNLWNFLIDEHVAIDYIKHALYFIELAAWVNES
jgi:hypothetical protein